jgi:alpha-2-macroglobulin
MLLAAAPGVARADSAPPTVAFSPQGTIKNIRQAVARFSQPMVPLGDPRVRQSPFRIDCPVHGTPRWIDSRQWSYDFDRDLPAGVRCTFTLAAGLKTLKGATVASHPPFVFDTGGPAVLETRPWMGSGDIDEHQAFVLVLDAEPVAQTVLDHVEFSVQGMAQRVGANIMGGPDRDLLLKRFADFVNHRPVIILQARQTFPDNAKVTLIWGKGIATASGIATAQNQEINFRVRPAFEAQFRCERESPQAACIPLTPMSLSFSAPIAAGSVKRVAIIGPDGTRRAAQLPDGAELSDVRSVTFPGPFEESAHYTIAIPADLTDDDGRPLANASRFPLAVATDEFPPLAKFSARFGIIEAADPVLPITVRNLEPILRGLKLKASGMPSSTGAPLRDFLGRIDARIFGLATPQAPAVLSWLRRVASSPRQQSVFANAELVSVPKPFTLPRPNDATAFEVLGIPLRKPGLYVVELESERLGAVLLGKNAPMYVPTVALVTNLSVHFKQGAANSLIWVTRLEDAKPAAGAAVAIADCHGRRLWSGTTDRQGLALVPKIDAVNKPEKCADVAPNKYDFYTTQTEALRELGSGVLVTAHLGNDFSFVHSSWHYGIEPWRFHLPLEWNPTDLAAHTVLDRPLLRACETVHMKHFLRARTIGGFAMVPPEKRPTTLTIRGVGGDQHYDFPLKWNSEGIAETDWAIPKSARLGQYAVAMRLRPDSASKEPVYPNEIQTADFRVEEFRVPLMKAAIRMPSQVEVGVTSIPVDISAEYLSGGAASAMPVTLRSQIQPNASVFFPAFEGFAFANGAVKQGTVTAEQWYEGFENVTPPGVHQRADLTLDAAGGARTTITDIARSPTPIDVRAEMEYRDPDGETQTVSNSITIWPAKWLVGIRADDWVSSPGHVRFRVAVVAEGGKPVAGAPVRVEIFTRKTFSYRKRLVGGFYAYDNTVETRRAGDLCSGTTDPRGLLLCDARTPITGSALVQASVHDDAGNPSTAFTEVFIPGKTERLWFQGHDEDRMDLLPEQPQYQPGDTARFQVRMPFAEATALVTVEREGIVAASVIHLSGHNPVITLPVRNYAPNMFVSVLAIRGRIGSPQPTGMVDLAKPAFRLGIAEIRVGWRANRLNVTVTPQRRVYHVREKAHVTIAVRTASGAPPPAGSQIAIAAVDQGLLELASNESWKLLDAMMGRRPYQVDTATAQMQVVGKRHYGLKALPPGGGGGRRITRELFDTLLLWKATVPLDAAGNASIDVPLNDSLTSFRIVAIASGGVGMFGTGDALIQSTQDLMILPGVSPIIRTGDSFDAEFTVRNASERAFAATVNAKIEGVANQPAAQTLDLAPGQGKTIDWKVAVPTGVSELRYHVEATSGTGGPSDHLKITQRVLPVVPVRTYQATLMRWEKPIAEPVALPADALAGRGDVQVALSPSLSAGLGGVREWMRAYPYTCLEQRVSRAIALGDAAMWNGIAADLPQYLDGDGLLKFFPAMREGSDILTSYVFAIAHEAGLTIPPQSEEAMVRGLRGFIAGTVVRYGAVPGADLPLRKIAAIEALSSAGQANPAMLGSIIIEPNLWPDATVIEWWNILLRLHDVADHARRIAEAEQIVRSRLNWQGTGAHLSGGHCWCLMTDTESNMLRLDLLLIDNNLWHDEVGRVIQGAVRLQSRGAWTTTLANAWGTLAVEKFARAFESVPVKGTTVASLAAASQRLDWAHDPDGGTLSLAWPPAQADLHVDHQGSGNPWVQIRTRAAIPLKSPFSSGYRITRTLSAVDKTHTGGWRRGDVVRVHLKIEAQTDMTWVVVNDPLPAGASHLGTGLRRDSAIATAGENSAVANGDDYYWPDFIERPFDAFRAYYRFIPKGTFEVEYTIRLNQAGVFQLPTTRVEALYEPEMMGEILNAPFEVAP